MPPRSRKQQKDKQKLMFRDDFLMVLALSAAGVLYWQAKENPGLAVVLETLSYVLGAIGALIFYGIMATRKSRREQERRRKNLL